MHLAAHLLALFLIVVGPVWDYFEGRLLKAKPSHERRLRYYWRTLAWLLVATGVACWSEGLDTLVTLRGLGIQTTWLESHTWLRWLLAALVIVIVLLQLVLPVIQVTVKYWKTPLSRTSATRTAALLFTLIRSGAPLVRGVKHHRRLLRRDPLPRLPAALPSHHAAAPGSAMGGARGGRWFSAAHHLYQGTKGFISTSIGGLIFTLILLVTGSLWAGMAYPRRCRSEPPGLLAS